jgi:hypothetical protein
MNRDCTSLGRAVLAEARSSLAYGLPLLSLLIKAPLCFRCLLPWNVLRDVMDISPDLIIPQNAQAAERTGRHGPHASITRGGEIQRGL